MKFFCKKGDVETSQLIGWAIAIGVFIIFFLFFIKGGEWGKGAVDFVRNLVRFGR